MRYVTVPGIGGSGPDHWQTLWDADLPATRISPASWDQPDHRDWSAAIDRAVAASSTRPAASGAGATVHEDGAVLIAHSLGCLAAAAWLLERGPGPVVAAMLVAVPDPEGPAFPEAVHGFAALRAPLPVPTLVVVSDDDPYATPAWTRALAADWGATVADVGSLGHINGASGLGAWSQGRTLLAAAIRDETTAAAVRQDQIVIKPYDPRWAESFATQKDVLEATLGDQLIVPIEHIGSTAVPGLPAKPIIDMLAVIDRYEAFASASTELERVGWILAPEPGDFSQRKWSVCFPSVEHRTHHLHVVERDSAGWPEWLVFRDYLRTHPEQAARYAALKQELSAVDAEDRPRYRAGKAPLIRELTDRARTWRRSSDDHPQYPAKALPTAVSTSADTGRQ